MKLLIAILSCNRDAHLHDVVRDTWLIRKPANVDHCFFMGHGSRKASPDELIVDAGDDYSEITQKSRAMFQWALNHNYDFVFHCGRDTYINVERLVNAGLEPYDYAGHRTIGGEQAHLVELVPTLGTGWFPYASGGAGSWLSRRAMQLIVNSKLYHQADDLLYGWILGSNGVQLYHDPRFMKHGDFLEENAITVHLSKGTGKYQPEQMYNAHWKSL